MSEANDVDEPIMIGEETWASFATPSRSRRKKLDSCIFMFALQTCLYYNINKAINSEPERSNIMNTQQDQVPQNTEELREIPKWTRKYAQNRILASYVVIGIGMLTGLIIIFLLALVITAFVKGKMTLAGIGIVVLAAILISLLIIIRKFGGTNRGWIDQLIYGHEGIASMPPPELTKKTKWLGFAFAVVVFICTIGTYHFSKEGTIVGFLGSFSFSKNLKDRQVKRLGNLFHLIVSHNHDIGAFNR